MTRRRVGLTLGLAVVPVASILVLWLWLSGPSGSARPPSPERRVEAATAQVVEPVAAVPKVSEPVAADSVAPPAIAASTAARERVKVTGFADPSLPEPPPPTPDQVSSSLPPQRPFDVEEKITKRTEGLKFLKETEDRLQKELTEAEAKADKSRAEELRHRLARLTQLQKERRSQIEMLKQGKQVGD